MNILDRIIVHKRKEVSEKSSLVPVKLLEKSIYFESQGGVDEKVYHQRR
jgi:indole-3-glycerol phosphate synthase